ncbi:ImcF-related family protein [Flexibacterium corallicola]|uniref:ImcF-related family protein n=1 Tax=Flexibacterium corallicola TaxID=3037259 RepID=UPI00286F12AC|nr:ImcF-related family protein [Pseudovibrio sp. M1P-2-3]
MRSLRIALGVFTALAVLQLLVLLVLLFTGFLSGFASGIWALLLAVVSLCVGGAAFYFRSKIWVEDRNAQVLRRLRSSIQKQYRKLKERSRTIDRNDFSVPWNLFLAMDKGKRTTTMAELGYVCLGAPIHSKGLKVSTWTSPTAVAYRIEIAPEVDLSFDMINILFGQILSHRPSLAVNGAYVEYDLAGLMSPDVAETNNISAINRILNVACKTFGIDIPLHITLSGLEHIPDLHKAATHSGLLGSDAILGGFIEKTSGQQADNIDRLFNDLISSLNNNQLEVLEKQVVSEESASVVNAPMQLALIKAQAKERITQLTNALPPRRKKLNLQSVAFVGASEDMFGVDPLGQVSGQRFFQSPPVSQLNTDRADSVTAKSASLLAAAYHKESFGIEPNKRFVIKGRFKSLALTSSLVVLVTVLGALIWKNHRDYVALNGDVGRAFDSYYSKIGAIGKGADTLAMRVELLAPLHQGMQAYKVLDESLVRKVLPNGSLHSTYKKLYDQEIVEGLQYALFDHLEKDMFAYNALVDGVELVYLASLDAQFRQDQAGNASNLTYYYVSSLAEQGEVSQGFQRVFAAVLNDLFTLNQPLVLRNEELRQVVVKTLSGLETADLLYEALMRRSAFVERVDLRQQIGPRFTAVFEEIATPQAYLVPRAYTKSGFQALFEDEGMPELDALISSYESVIGSLDEAQISIIQRSIADRYKADYIAVWTRFIDSLQLREAQNWADAQILIKAFSSANESPMKGLVAAILTNTVLEVTPLETEVNTGTGVRDRTLAFSLEHDVAQSIRGAFRPYVEAAQAAEGGKSEFDLFVQYSRAVMLWLDNIAGSSDGAGRALFDQFQTVGQETPLSELYVLSSRSELDILRNFGRALSVSLDRSAMEFVYSYIDRQWQLQILDPYEYLFLEKYPFAIESTQNFPLAVFTELFGDEGKIQKFADGYLARFNNVEGPQQTFIPSGTAQLSEQAQNTLKRASQIHESMFAEGKPFLAFNVRTSFMDSRLSRVNLSSGVTLLQYTHGPIIWREQNWPLTGIKNGDLTLRIFQRYSPVITRSFKGPWSWFRLVGRGNVSINPSLGVTDSAFSKEGKTTTLQFSTDKKYNPFSPGFFSDLELPYSLFERSGEEPKVM